MTRSIQQLPNNSGSTSVTEVYTATGFNAGDPVYFQNGDYKSPANLPAPSSVNFNFTTQDAYVPYSGGGIIAPSFTYTQMQTSNFGGTPRKFAAVLTNGNIVQAYLNASVAQTNPSCVYFRIVNSSGTVVVGPTVVSTTYTANYPSVGVVALTGGGFAISWTNTSGGTSNSVNYAIYSNTGSVVTAATQDTSFTVGAAYTALETVSLANGGFAVAVKYTSSAIYLRAYGSTGTGAYATQSVGINAASGSGNLASFGIASRSDSSVFICDFTAPTTITYVIYSSSGTAIVSATNFTVSSVYQGVDASVLADGTTIVIAYNNLNGNGNNFPALRFLPTGNTLGSEIVGIPDANLFYRYGSVGKYISVIVTSANNIMLFFSDGFGNMQYAFYNSSGTCISGSNSSGAIPLQINGGYCFSGNRVTLIESSGLIYAYWSSTNPQTSIVQQFYCKISTSTYNIIPFASISSSTYSITGQPTGAPIASTVNPNGLSYYTTSSSTTVSTNTPSTVVSATAISNTAIDSIASCTLPNGNFVVVYKSSGGNIISGNVFTATGSQVTSLSIATDGYTSGVYAVKVAPLSGGGFAVMYATSTSAFTLLVYSSSYILSASQSNIAQYSFSTNYQFDMCGLPDNNFAIVFSNDGTNGAVRVYTSALSNIYSIGLSGTPSGFSIASNSCGAFGVAYFSGGQGLFRAFVPVASNSWSQSNLTSWSMGAYVQDPQLCATQSGTFIVTSYGSGYPAYGMLPLTGSLTVSYTGGNSSWPPGSGSGPNSYPMMGIGLTGNGNLVIATTYSGQNLGILCVPSQITYGNGGVVPYQNSSGANIAVMFSNNVLSLSVAYDLGSQPRVIPGVGNNAIITFRGLSGSGQYPCFIIVNGTSNSNVYPIVAGTTPSALVPVAPISNSSTVGISGVFAGVALTTASAGSTGQVAINGQALLGSSYTSTATGAFDSTGNAVSGVKGTFNGRSVNLQGNS
jgi:hypothetical protein